MSVLLAVASAAPQYRGGDQYNTSPIPILKYDSQKGPDGSYSYGYETGNGINVQESGYVKNLGVKDAETQVAQGYYSYTGPDGVPVSIQYTADENGFVATGSHIPTPPPLPKVRSITRIFKNIVISTSTSFLLQEIADVWAKLNQPLPYPNQPYNNNRKF